MLTITCWITNTFDFYPIHSATVQNRFPPVKGLKVQPICYTCCTSIRTPFRFPSITKILSSVYSKLTSSSFITNTYGTRTILSSRGISKLAPDTNQKKKYTLQFFRQEHNFIFTSNNKPQLTTTKETVQFNFLF